MLCFHINKEMSVSNDDKELKQVHSCFADGGGGVTATSHMLVSVGETQYRRKQARQLI